MSSYVNIHDYNIDGLHRTIYLIENNLLEENNIVNQFIKNIHILSDHSLDRITIHLFHFGGDWTNGMAIFDVINTCKCHTTIIAHGTACSMGSLIMQAADDRLMMPNSYMLLHHGELNYSGNPLAIEQETIWHQNNINTMLDVYAQRCVNGQFFKQKKHTKQQIKQFLSAKIKSNAEWYLDPNECLKYGLIDGIVVNGK